MSFGKKLREKLQNPHWAVLIAVYAATIGATAGAIVLVTSGELAYPFDLISYIVYALAALLLAYTVFTLVTFVPKIKNSIAARCRKHEFTAKLMSQYGFRTVVFAAVTLIISVGNVAVNGALGILELSIWYGALAVYYLLLVVMRGSVLLFHRGRRRRETKDNGEWRHGQATVYRNCGVGLIILPVCLSFAIVQMVRGDNSFEHAGMMIYVSAAYAFYKIIMSTINFVRARKNEDMTVRAVRNVNLADALVSMLALETAMFKEFSPAADVGLWIGLTGGIVCALTAALGIFMLINGSKKLKTLREEKTSEREG